MTQLRQTLRARVPNMAKFAADHDLPLRTLWRVLAGQAVRKGTAHLINAALDKEVGKS